MYESAKKALSTSTQATIEIDLLFEGFDINAVITRCSSPEWNVAAYQINYLSSLR